jgi:hypothetical protein
MKLAALCAIAAAACGGARPAPAVALPESPSATIVDVAPTVEEAVEAGRQWRLDTPQGPVHVWAPAGYDRATAQTIVYVHGYFTDVDGAWQKDELPAQFARSGLNALFIACEAPSSYDQPVRWTSLAQLLEAVRTGIDDPLPRGPVIAVGHSAAFRTLTAWLPEHELDTLVLFDAAYETDQFVAWVNASKAHRLIDVGDDTRAWTERLHSALPDTIVVDHVPAPGSDELPVGARVLYIKSDVGHMPLVEDGVALPVVLRALTARRVTGAPAFAPLDVAVPGG